MSAFLLLRSTTQCQRISSSKLLLLTNNSPLSQSPLDLKRGESSLSPSSPGFLLFSTSCSSSYFETSYYRVLLEIEQYLIPESLEDVELPPSQLSPRSRKKVPPLTLDQVSDSLSLLFILLTFLFHSSFARPSFTIATTNSQTTRFQVGIDEETHTSLDFINILVLFLLPPASTSFILLISLTVLSPFSFFILRA
jgi:hypothetical protein